MPGNLADFNVSESIGPDELRSDKTPNYRCSGAAITARINDYRRGYPFSHGVISTLMPKAIVLIARNSPLGSFFFLDHHHPVSERLQTWTRRDAQKFQ